MRIIASVLQVLLFGTVAVSQATSPPPAPQRQANRPLPPSKVFEDALAHAADASEGPPKQAELNKVNQSQCDKVDPDTKVACLEMWNGFYRAASEHYANNNRVYVWQLVASWTLLAAMIILMSIGLWIAISQFYLSFRLATLLLNKHPATKEGDAEPATLSGLKELLYSNFEVSKGGLKLSSPIVGIIVLCLSMVFLWVFAREIYPIVQR
jgi:hypothetical protein